MKLGAYYWSGWYSMEGHGLRERLLDEFPDREPVWGWVSGTVSDMETEIKIAKGGGLDFFAFDWYYPMAEDKYSPMNDCVDLYLKAKNRDEMEFCLLVANHDSFRIFRKDWEAVVDLWIPYLKSDRAVKINGKPLIIFFAGLTECLGGSAAVRECMDYFHAKAKEAGLAGVFVASCMFPDSVKAKEQIETGRDEGYDGFTGYNYIDGYHYTGPEPYIHTYAELADRHVNAWDRFAEYSPLPYLPIVTCGWDCRPWEPADGSPHRSFYYPDRTPKQVYEFITKAKEWTEKNASKTANEKIVMLYAWNEMGEGGYLMPTKGDPGLYLDAVKRAKG